MLNILKENLSEELYSQVSEALKGKELEKYIPKSRFDEVNEKAKKLAGYADYDEIKNKLDEANAKLEGYDELKAKADKVETMADYEEIKKGFEDIKEKYDNTVNSNQKLILKNIGLDEKFIDFSLSQIKVGEDQDFKKAAEEYVKTNPQFKSETFQKYDSQFNVGGGSKQPIPEDPEKYLKFRQTHDIDGTPLKKE